MEPFDLPVAHNPLQTKRDLFLALEQLCAPLHDHFSPGCARLHLGTFSAHYPDSVAGMEGFSRLLWGLAPALAGGREPALWREIQSGIRNGTDPQSPEYWGGIADYDQRIVEMAAFGYALALAPEKLRAALGGKVLQNLADWLGQINRHKAYDCNWLLFAVVVNLGLRRAGLPFDRKRIEESLERIESFYLGNGWYSDGPGGHRDYYISFAIHFYCLFYARVMDREDPRRSSLYKERAALFAKAFALWFSPDGSAIPYGRSLTYRFAQTAFWGALAFAGVEAFPAGVIKGIVLRHLRWWFARPIFDAQGVLTVGYGYQNLVMAEDYNSPGSPYWAFKAFLALALPEDGPFWASEELPLPEFKERSVQEAPHFVLCRRANHVAAFSAGDGCIDGHTHCAAKYEKFVYSTLFGFSVPRAEYGLGQGAYDSMLALSEGGELFRVRRTGEQRVLSENAIETVWHPWADVTVRTVLLPGLPWHVRLHEITSPRALAAADGGFALGIDGFSPENEYASFSCPGDAAVSGVLLASPFGRSGAVCLWGCGESAEIKPNSNTNLLFPRTMLPTIRFACKPGVTRIVTAFCGAEAAEGGAEAFWKSMPAAAEENGKLAVYGANRELLYLLPESGR